MINRNLLKIMIYLCLFNFPSELLEQPLLASIYQRHLNAKVDCNEDH